MGVGIKIKQILRAKGMTIKELATLSGVPLNTLYSITKRDSSRIDPVIRQQLSETLGVPEYLLIPESIDIRSDTVAESSEGAETKYKTFLEWLSAVGYNVYRKEDGRITVTDTDTFQCCPATSDQMRTLFEDIVSYTRFRVGKFIQSKRDEKEDGTDGLDT